MAKRSGRPSAAQTPAPKSDKIVGSNTNKKGSATSKGASSIKLSDKTISALKTKLDNFKKKYPKKDNVSLSDLKAVYRRGSGAFSGSHRPNMSRAGWAYARANKFLEKAAGKKVKAAYVQDDDLLKYEEGGLIAPNGKKSNLTPEQYKLVRTPEFKKWFGDWENDPENASKVVDENGEPLVVYRGMPKKRRVGNVFKYNVNLFGTKGVGGRQTNKFAFYFTDIKQVAEDYVNDITEDEGGYVVKSYFLNVRKLFKAFSKKNQYETTFKELYDLANTDGNPVYFRNYRGEIETDYKGNKKEFWNHQYEWERKYNNKFPNKNEPFVFFVDWDKTEGNQYFWRAYLEDYLKYNGLFFYETTNNAVRLKLNDDLKPKYGDEFSKTYGVFEPNQIKLADGSNTTFDESNPDIRFDEGGKLKATGDCYYAAGQLAMLNENIDYVGTPYLVHAEVKGQGKIKGISYGHAWIEDDENVYDFSNGKRNIIPKDFYYLLGGVKTNNPKKYRKYTFSEATQKMLDTGNYGCWDLDVEYLKGGLIAPNGKKSNLTPEQYELVRTPEFKAWFGNWENDPENASQVVDDNGEPKVVYHGTYVETEFNIFDFYKADLGFHFGTYEQAKNRLTTKRKQEGYKSIILPYFLNIRHITEINDHTEFEYPQRYVYDLMDEKLITESEFRKNDFSNAYYKEDNKKIRDFLIEKYGNKIGFIYNNKYEGEGYSYIVLVPNQIKLADGKNTTFDESNPDIRYKKGGLIAPNGKKSNLTPEQYELVRTPEFKAWFGDWENDPENASKILNENGEPLVCFHGSNQTFDIFNEKYIGSANDRGFYGRGFYFTFQKQTKYFKAAFDEAGYYGDKIIGCFIKSINPFNIEILSKYKGYDINYIGIESIVFLSNLAQMFPQLADKITIEKNVWNPKKEEYDYTDVPISILPTLIKKYAKLLKTYITENQWGKRNIKSGYVKNEIQEYIDSNGKKQSYESMDSLGRWEFRIDKGVQSPSDEEIEIGLIRDAIEKYDGITVRYYTEGYMTRYPEITDAIRQKHDSILQNESGDELVVFESNQIKLSDGTNTTFDESNPDIRYEEGGNLTKENLVELSKSDFNNIVELIQNSIVDKFDEDIISRIQFLRHSIHSTNVNDIFYGNTRFDNEIEEISDEIEKLNIIGNEEKIANKIRKFSCLEGCDRKFDGGHEDEDMEKDDYSEEAYSEISEEKEAINKLVENYLQQLDEVWDNYDLNNVSDIRRKKTFKPSGFLRARSILGTGVENTSKSKKFDNKINDIILEEYYKSKKDGSNLKLVKIIDNLIKKSTYKEGGDIGQEITCSNCGWEWNTEDSKGKDKYTCHKCGKINNKNNNYMKNGGELNPDNKETKEYYSHKSGNVGGMLVGNRHSEGGIKATNKSNGQPIEMEGGEVVITRNAVSDNTKREFNGQMLTNKQILSKINQSGGGVSFEDGGELPENIMVSGKEYSYGGKVMKDHEIVSSCGCKHSMAEGGEVNDRQAYYATLSNKSYEHGGELDTDDLNDTEKNVLNHLKRSIHGLIKIDREHCKDLDNIQKKGIVYITQSDSHSCKDVKLTDYGIEVVRQMGDLQFKKGGEVGCMECGCKEYKKGGTTDENTKYYKGTKHEYNNQFEINKAIEELITDIEAKDLTPEEKQFVSYYAGYGGLEKFGAKGKGLLYEYFTPSEIAKKMWGLAYKHGFKGGLVLEPSCGIGEFIKYAPEQNLVTGYEINEFSAKICKILYPMATIQSKYFETLFIKNNNSIRDKTEGMNKYSLIIGNPPYGSMGGIYAGLGEKSYTKANNYIDYFIFRGLDLLQTDGLLIYIIGTEVAAGGVPFLQQGMNAFKENITKKADIVDAYRLPNGLFETTDVLTDIIVFKKR